MNGTNFVVDTNILIQVLQDDDATTEFLDQKTIFISFITEMELLGKHGLGNDEIKIIQSLINNCILIDFNSEIKTQAIKFRRNQRLKLPDAIIAATCLYLKLPLLTFDTDFQRIKEIEVLFLSR